MCYSSEDVADLYASEIEDRIVAEQHERLRRCYQHRCFPYFPTSITVDAVNTSSDWPGRSDWRGSAGERGE